jgi:hypothetical protein
MFFALFSSPECGAWLSIAIWWVLTFIFFFFFKIASSLFMPTSFMLSVSGNYPLLFGHYPVSEIGHYPTYESNKLRVLNVVKNRSLSFQKIVTFLIDSLIHNLRTFRYWRIRMFVRPSVRPPYVISQRG